jgi:hypothetical protein
LNWLEVAFWLERSLHGRFRLEDFTITKCAQLLIVQYAIGNTHATRETYDLFLIAQHSPEWRNRAFADELASHGAVRRTEEARRILGLVPRYPHRPQPEICTFPQPCEAITRG